MSMIDAFRFFASARTQAEFREALYLGRDSGAVRAIIEASGYRFTDGEAGDALQSLALRAVDEYEAEEIAELGQWYRALVGGVGTPCGNCAAR